MKYKIGLIEDDIMMRYLISERILRGKDNNVIVESIDFENNTLDSLIDYIYNEKFDAIIVDHKLKSSNSNIDYEGTDIANSLEELLYFFPVFVLTSYELDAESKKYVDVNLVYQKDKYVEDEVGDYVDYINRKIFTQVDHYKSRILDIQKEIVELKNKEFLNDEEKEKLLLFDHYIEVSVCGKKALPLHLKKEDESLKKLIDLAQSILYERDEH